MANKSNWKYTEKKAARLFPGGRRRPRVGGDYSMLADDVIFGPEIARSEGGKTWVEKLPLKGMGGRLILPPVFIECKKRKAVKAISDYRRTEAKYIRLYQKPEGEKAGANLVMVFHVLREQRQFVMLSDSFFHELFSAWLMFNEVDLKGL